MVYAVACETVRRFEFALGRPIRWRVRPGSRRASPYHGRLRIFPHAFQQANAFYDPRLCAVLFGGESLLSFLHHPNFHFVKTDVTEPRAIRDALKKTPLFSSVPPEVWKKDWVVDCEPAGSGEEVLKYFTPYIYRVALSNRRLVRFMFMSFSSFRTGHICLSRSLDWRIPDEHENTSFGKMNCL
jgi:hypothetical protein